MNRPLAESKDVKKNEVNPFRDILMGLLPPSRVRPEDRLRLQAVQDGLKSDYQQGILQLFGSKRPVGDVGQDIEDLILKNFSKAWSNGKGMAGFFRTAPSTEELANIVRAAQEESVFMRKFYDTYANGGMSDAAFKNRVGMYLRTLDGISNLSQIHSLPDDAVIDWQLRPAEHCNTCIKLAARSPYSKPNVGVNPLPTVPRAGHTECLSNCRCVLVISYAGEGGTVGPPIGNVPVPSQDVRTFNNLPVNDDVRATPEFQEFQDQSDQLFKDMATARQAIELTAGNERDLWIRERSRINAELIRYMKANGSTAVPMASVTDIVAPIKEALSDGWRNARANDGIVVNDKIGVVNGLSFQLGKVVSARNGDTVTVKFDNGDQREVDLNFSENNVVFKKPDPGFDADAIKAGNAFLNAQDFSGLKGLYTDTSYQTVRQFESAKNLTGIKSMQTALNPISDAYWAAIKAKTGIDYGAEFKTLLSDYQKELERQTSMQLQYAANVVYGSPIVYDPVAHLNIYTNADYAQFVSRIKNTLTKSEWSRIFTGMQLQKQFTQSYLSYIYPSQLSVPLWRTTRSAFTVDGVHTPLTDIRGNILDVKENSVVSMTRAPAGSRPVTDPLRELEYLTKVNLQDILVTYFDPNYRGYSWEYEFLALGGPRRVYVYK